MVIDPADYARVLAEIARGRRAQRGHALRLAQKAFAHTAAYDGAIGNYLTALEPRRARGEFPDAVSLQFRKRQDLRYGENPHQSARSTATRAGAGRARALHGSCRARSSPTTTSPTPMPRGNA